MTTPKSWFCRIGFAAVAALSLGATTLASSPVQAQEFHGRPPIAAAWHRVSHFPRFFFGHGHYGHHYGYWR